MFLTDATASATADAGVPGAGHFSTARGSITAADPSTAAEALELVRAGLEWLASVDAAGLTGAERADCLRGLARAESAHLAATSKILRAFDAAEDYAADGQSGPRTWLRWQTRTTRSAAAAALAWSRRLAARPQVTAALAAGSISVSYARQICDWASELPADVQDAAEDILIQAAAGGAEIGDLAALAGEIQARTARPDTDGDDGRFGQRRVWLDTYYRGHGSLHGDLSPQAAAAVRAVLDALNGRTGPEDIRTKSQRDHDALEEACRRLIASGCLPGRAGQPVQLQLHLTLSQLAGQPETEPALAAWIRATGAAAPPGADCDAQIIPIVTGTIDPTVLAGLAARHPALAGLAADHGGSGGSSDKRSPTDDHPARPAPTGTDGGSDGTTGDGAGGTTAGRSPGGGPTADGSTCSGTTGDGAGGTTADRNAGGGTTADRNAGGGTTADRNAGGAATADGSTCSGGYAAASRCAASGAGNRPGTSGEDTLSRATRAAAALSIADAVRLLSGPGGLAARLRGQLTGPAGTPSLPLDVGTATDTIPVHIRRAVTRRDGQCRFPGCDQPPATCHVHHLRPRAAGGGTSVANCLLLCAFHHLTAVHRWGWQLTLNPDGTTTATSPDRARVLHSHAPPTAA